MNQLSPVIEKERFPSPAPTPQALAWHEGLLWIGSRDLRRIYAIDVETWAVRADVEAPGIPWAAVSAGGALWLTIGEGPDDDRYLRSFVPNRGFSERVFACPEFTGSYLSHDGEHLYLSQWYKHRILKLDRRGNILRAFDAGAEISGQTFVEGVIYVLRGTEQGSEEWRIARFDPRQKSPHFEDLAAVPFQCRSLGFTGTHFWSSHRAADMIVSFSLPVR